MRFEVNGHVERMGRFQPFNAKSADSVYEQGDPTERSFTTAAFQHVLNIVDEPSVRIVVLTGDAGHGKTHLCALLLQKCGLESREAHRLIQNEAMGDRDLTLTPVSKRPLRIVKDLSDIEIVAAGELLANLRSLDDDTVTVVCANEGRLRRAVAKSADPELDVFTKTLEAGIVDGVCAAIDPAVHVVNLNYQSVVGEADNGLVDWVLNTWGSDGRSWRTCNKCKAQASCPIFENHRLLADPERGKRRRERIKKLFATAERTGAVITIRQALAAVAYSLTGGLNCKDVHRRSLTDEWQYKHLFHQALFGDRLSASQRPQVPIFTTFRRLDPGSTALRAVDDLLDPTTEKTNFLPPMPLLGGVTPKSRRDAQRESETLHNVLRFLRRREFFDEDSGPEPFERMGLRSGKHFEQAATGDLGDRATTEVRDILLRGLEAVQGVRRPANPPDLLVLDPAFVNHRSRAAVVGRRVQSRRVTLRGQVAQWSCDNEPELPDAVDWLSRLTFIDIDGYVCIPLNLFRFELLQRWAEGLRARTEHVAEIRLINGLLAKAVPHGEMDEIVVLVGSERRTLSIDVGERIRSGEA
ncbi:hypothetical protein [Amycolatopsis sp. lyj-84]|uniref:hypothetical protein n=1 Tax=Amycolatopsis sp. lyj-84 TaxID=2789284 RepID=UPI00397C291D